MKKRILTLLLALCTLLSLVSCKEEPDLANATKLSFSSALSYEYLKSIDGSAVTINGYLASSSPADGSFIFLMNMPYQNCPFCVPNTTQLSNTIEVYPKKNATFDYTTRAVKVVGRLEVATDPEKPFTDPYGYEFVFKIVDAEYTVLKDEELSTDMALWQRVAGSGIIDEIYRMYDYLNFVCTWNTYFVNTWTDAEGAIHTGYYLYASDALSYVTNEKGQYYYGYTEGYFDELVAEIRKIDSTALEELVENVYRAKALAEEAVQELQAGHYTYEKKYVEKFGKEDYIFTLNKGEELRAEMDRIYAAFANWLGSFEL